MAAPCLPCNPQQVYYDEFAHCPCGYQVGDILTIQGGTQTVQATLIVTAINAETGSVTTANVANGGNYTVFPANPASVTSGGGTGATFNLVNVGTAVTNATVVAGGGPWPDGYRVGDVCQLEGGIFLTAASVLVTATNVGGQVTGISIRTAGSGYSVNPCQPATTFGGHGCGLKVQWTIVGGVMTLAVIADAGGPCHKPRRQWWQRTEVNVWGPGSGPPAIPRTTAWGMLNPPGTEADFARALSAYKIYCAELVAPGGWETDNFIRPLSRAWLPTGTDVNAACCNNILSGDVLEIPAGSGRLYNAFFTEWLNTDSRCRCRGPCSCCEGEKMLVALTQQCPFGVFPEPPLGDWLVADDGFTILTADPWHYLTPV